MVVWCVSEYPGWLAGWMDGWMERSAEERRRKEMRMRMRVYDVAVKRSKGGRGRGLR
jgi:hypothetical protein